MIVNLIKIKMIHIIIHHIKNLCPLNSLLHLNSPHLLNNLRINLIQIEIQTNLMIDLIKQFLMIDPFRIMILMKNLTLINMHQKIILVLNSLMNKKQNITIKEMTINLHILNLHI